MRGLVMQTSYGLTDQNKVSSQLQDPKAQTYNTIPYEYIYIHIFIYIYMHLMLSRLPRLPLITKVHSMYSKQITFNMYENLRLLRY